MDVELERENENGDNTFVSAIKAENIKVIKEMIDKGLDVNNVDKNGDNALHIYFGNKSEHMRLLQRLIKEGTKINAFNSEGFSPLYLAIKNGEGNQVEELLEHGADIYNITEDGKTALDIVNEVDNKEIENIINQYNENQALEKEENHDNGNEEVSEKT